MTRAAIAVGVVFAAAIAVLALAVVDLRADSHASDGAPVPFSEDPGSLDTQLELGATLFAWNCAVCHGATGGGLAEAKLAFPPDHHRCTRCHKPSNPAQQSLENITDDHDMFDLGTPPRLIGDGSLASFPNVLALRAYIQATMPRYEPGRLSEAEYRAIGAWLLDENGRLEGPEPVTPANAAERGRASGP